MAARILVVDDHEVVRRGEASNGKEAISAAKELRPDIIILDVTMPVMNGFQAALQLEKLGHPILIFTMHESARLGEEVRKCGASGYVLKSQASRDLILAIESLLAGGTFFGGTGSATPRENRGGILGIFLRQALGVGTS